MMKLGDYLKKIHQNELQIRLFDSGILYLLNQNYNLGCIGYPFRSEERRVGKECG